MKIHHVHPKFLNGELISREHDFLHQLFDSLAMEESMEHPDSFRFNGRRGLLYIRHRKLVEEMNANGVMHETPLDRKLIDADEWNNLEVAEQEILDEAAELRKTEAGRVPLPDSENPEDYTLPDEFNSVIVGIVEDEILVAMWRIMRFLVMERSYTRYRALSETLQGRRRGSVWMLIDLMLEEAFSVTPDEGAPAIAYESVWELLEDAATEEEKTQYIELTKKLHPGKVSLEMRRFLAGAAVRQGNQDLQLSALLMPYI
jgi:hypothetical protein